MKKLLLINISLLLVYMSYGQANYSYTFTMYPLDLKISTSTIEGYQFQAVKLSDLGYLRELGHPKLPVKTIQILVPMNTNISNVSLSVINEQACNITDPIEPVQEDIPTSIVRDTTVFQYDSLVYNSVLYPTSNIETNLQYYGGIYGILTVSYCPFKYNPKLGTLKLITESELNISFNTIKGANELPLNPTEDYHNLISKSLQSTVINPEFLSSYILNTYEASQTLSNGLEVYEYVIVTTNALKNSFTDFVNWKMSKGIHTGVVTIEDILLEYSEDNIFPGDEILDDAGALRQYLYEAYQEGLTWVLLAGDQPNIPIRYGTLEVHYWPSGVEYKQIPADIYFADFDGNWNVDGDIYYGEFYHDDPDLYPEVFLGRLIASTTQHIENWTSKVIKYESNPGNGNYDYLDDAFMFQADEMQHGQEAELVAGHLTSFSSNIFNELPSYDSPVPTFPKGTDIVNELNTNMSGLVGWFCHGGTGSGASGCASSMSGIGSSSQYWKIEAEDTRSDPNSEQETGNGLDNLTNIDFPNITYSISCDVMPFDKTSAMGNSGGSNSGEAFTVNATSGGIAFLGNTRSGVVGASAKLFSKFGDLVSNGCNGVTNLGVMESLSKALYAETGSKSLAYSHNLIGCPETKMWTEVPQTFNLSITPDNTFINQNIEYIVNVDGLSSSQEVLVTLYKESEVFERQYVVADVNGDAQVIFENIICQTSGNFSVVATSCNFIPNVSEILIKDCDLIEPDYEVTTDEIWTNDLVLHSNIIVKTGHTLTITGGAHMYADAKITVEAGAELIVDGGTITSACYNPWHGIVLLGAPDGAQTPSQQGTVTISNNALIENAKYAVTNVEGLGGGLHSVSGGRMFLSNSTFRNNKNDLYISHFTRMNATGTAEYGYASSFINLVFETTDEALNIDLDKHIFLQHVNGLVFRGNTFEDKRTNFDLHTEGRTGITAYYTGFEVNEICTGVQTNPPPATCAGDRNEFINLKQGVKAYGLSNPSQFTIDIKNTDFDCANGAYLMDVANTEVLLNNFTERENRYDVTTGEHLYGLYLDMCTDYYVEGNEFEGIATGIPAHLVGLVVKNQHTANTEIYRNSFDGLGAATEAIGQNKHPDWSTPTGLRLRCNEYNNGITNVYITEDTNNPGTTNGIALTQGVNSGLPDELAGNLFGTSSGLHIFNASTCGYFAYYHHKTSSNPRVKPSFNQGSFSVNEITTSLYGPESCPNNLAVQIIGSKSKATSEKQVIEDTEQTLMSLVDGGDTEALKQEVIFTGDAEAYDSYNDLMSKEGYLSETVLEEVAAKETALNKAMVRDVLVANPQAAKSTKVQDKLDTRLDPLPEYMRAQIQEGLTELSAKEYLDLRIAKAKVKHDYYIRKGVQQAIEAGQEEGAADPTDAVLTLLSNTNDLTFEYQKLEILDAKGRSTEAEQVLSLMQSMDKSQKQVENLQDFIDIRTMLKTWEEAGKNMHALEQADISALKGYSQKNNKAAAKAIAILAINNELDYIAPVYMPEDNTNRSAQTWSSFGAPTVEKDMLKLYPNPAKDYFTIEYSFTTNDKPIVLKVTDVQGKVVYTKQLQYKHDQLVINASTYSKGAYYISLFAGSQLIKSKSIQINK